MLPDNKLFVYKYQPLCFNDFGTDNAVIETLRSLITMDYLNIMLVGDIASGKTSFLNAVILEYYAGYSQKEYNDNVLYINNLKDQGINYYRTDVKTFCQTCSIIKNRKKIVVLDDIDLINEQSQQVFRNCIDKYGHNVHFISSCNNIQKVIETLQSRFTMVKMLQLKREILTKILIQIKEAENIVIDNDAQEFVINISNNTIKILITYMEKFKLLNEPITLDLAIKLCSNISFGVFEEYIDYCLNKKLDHAVQVIYEIYDKGYSVMDILDNLFFFIKTTNMINEDQKYIIIPYICKYITVFHNIHEDEIELALFTNNIVNQL